MIEILHAGLLLTALLPAYTSAANLQAPGVYEHAVTYKVHPDFESRSNDIQEAIKVEKILPGYLDHFNPPGELFVKYPYGDGYSVLYGNYISPMYAIEAPSVTFQSFFPYFDSFSQDLYLLAITDIGRDEQQNARAVWINLALDQDRIVNKTGPDKKAPAIKNDYFTAALDLKDDKALVQYLGPQPISGTGKHELVFILFRQPLGRLPYHHLKQRLNWGTNISGHGIQDWADYYGLQPIGVNFFESSDDGLY
ncbi:Carboxypeptidase Y inhibitor [Cyberlindnera fabianii]|uniref:Carboxypeptidase Y inhibitor n=1 Tax=Cyberlindnera fabianii TaxID=36022 RepID=A0A1V2L5Y4_CYBFA|nr:Carboxypeptidase Y inhibitor [Cyberlindnera fabianii]